MTSNLFLFAAFFAYSLIFSAVSAQNPTDEVPAQVVKDHAQQVNLKSDASSCDIAVRLSVKAVDARNMTADSVLIAVRYDRRNNTRKCLLHE